MREYWNQFKTSVVCFQSLQFNTDLLGIEIPIVSHLLPSTHKLYCQKHQSTNNNRCYRLRITVLLYYSSFITRRNLCVVGEKNGNTHWNTYPINRTRYLIILTEISKQINNLRSRYIWSRHSTNRLRKVCPRISYQVICLKKTTTSRSIYLLSLENSFWLIT